MSSPLPPNRSRRAAARRSAALRGALAGLPLSCAAVLCTAGCGSGFDAASLQVRPDTGAAQLGDLKIGNVVLVVDPATRNAEVIGAVANTGSTAAQLVQVTADGLPATVRPVAGPPPTAAALPLTGVTVEGNTVTIERRSAVSFGQLGRPELEIVGGSFQPGDFTRVVFGFTHAGRATITAMVMSNTGLYQYYDPNGQNTAKPSPLSVSGSPGPTGTGGTSSPSGTASPEVSPTVSPTAGSGALPAPHATPRPISSPISGGVASQRSGPMARPTPGSTSGARAAAPAKASMKVASASHPHG